MNKPVYGMIVGGVLGIFDGLSALLSAPEVAPEIAGIVAGSTVKGVIAGAIIGWFATRSSSMRNVVLFGLFIGALLAFLVAVMPTPDGKHYYWEIVLPGSILGLIVGFATQRYARPALSNR